MVAQNLSSKIVRSYIESELLDLNNRNQVSDQLKIGVELELYTYKINSNKELTPVYLYKGDYPLIISLVEIAEQYGGRSKIRFSEINSNTDLSQLDKIEFPNRSKIFFEPGGQIEISTTPCKSIVKLEEQLKFIQDILKEISLKTKVIFKQSGINPIPTDQLINQFQKQRYIALEKYLNTISPYGRQMMLNTCSMHINLDIGSNCEDTIVKRVLAANLLVPFATAIFANSNKINKETQLTYKSYRSYIWQNLDKARTGILPLANILKSMSVKALIDEYYKFIVNAPLIYNKDLGDEIFTNPFTLKYWMENQINGKWPNVSHLSNHTSLLFPEVRLKKGYIELRSIDSPPVDWQMVPVCFYAGILYHKKSLNKAIELLKPLYPNYNKIYKTSCFGLCSTEICNISLELIEISINGYSELPGNLKNDLYLNKLKVFKSQLLTKSKSFADFKD